MHNKSLCTECLYLVQVTAQKNQIPLIKWTLCNNITGLRTLSITCSIYSRDIRSHVMKFSNSVIIETHMYVYTETGAAIELL